MPRARIGRLRRVAERAVPLALLVVIAASGPARAQQRREHPLRADSSEQRRREHYTVQNSLGFAVVGVASFAVLWVLPEEISKWPREDRKLNHLLESYSSPPVWDRDPWFWNYVVHPVFGAYTYLAERNYDESPLRSFLFSTGTSVAWEYGFEAWIEHPSAQDLLVTSTTGSLLGELSHQATRRLGADGFSPGECMLLAVINPVYLVQRRGCPAPET